MAEAGTWVSIVLRGVPVPIPKFRGCQQDHMQMGSGVKNKKDALSPGAFDGLRAQEQ